MKKNPLVMCLTNTVAANWTANCLLAIGAKPAMIEEPCEAEELAAVSDAILLNLGTLTSFQAETMRNAVAIANSRHIPWVLDPVAIHILAFRRQFFHELITLKPSAIRGNHDEINSVLPLDPHIAVLSTGEVDCIYYDGKRTEITGGVQNLQLVTATGCAQGGIIAALLGMGKDPLSAVSIASRMMKIAGEKAERRVQSAECGGIGSFQIAILNELGKWKNEN